jgi:ABC-type nitrate/sulfonate/bicarbonate transport system substrate-binding protein
MQELPMIRTAFVLLSLLAASVVPAAAQQKPTVKFGYAKCAHCTPIALTPEYSPDVKIDAIAFNTGNDVLAALVSKSIDVAQITYQHYAIALDKGFDVVAISGQINGGSQMVLNNDVPVKPNDWDALKALIQKDKADGKLFRVAASRGNAQDLHMRGEFATHGIDINKDVQFINIPNPPDHAPSLRRGEVDLIATVEPFATQILQTGAGRFFDYPYDQAAGKLTNLIMTRSDEIADNKAGVQAAVTAVIKVNAAITADPQLWLNAITKITGLDKTIATDAMKNLYPDYDLHLASAEAIGTMMKDLKYISHDVSADIKKNMDYEFLIAATGKTKEQLGY